MKRWWSLVFGVSMMAGVAGCATAPPEKDLAGEKQIETMKETNVTQEKHAPRAVIRTAKGDIEIEFYPEDAPATVENFVKLARKGFYDGLTFHRVVPNFVIQGGDPKGDGTGGPGYTIKAEFNSRSHVDGAVAMARSSHPDSAGSQFYICLARVPHLDGQYTVFGQVVSGLDAVHAIRIGDVMEKVEVTE